MLPVLVALSVAGSSPRVRGKPGGLGHDHGHARIIPARAGQTIPFRDGFSIAPDHPRACGANEVAHTEHSRDFGSSPRVRGKRVRLRRLLSAHRIIPARAGQTRPFLGCACESPDHPRACGANAFLS